MPYIEFKQTTDTLGQPHNNPIYKTLLLCNSADRLSEVQHFRSTSLRLPMERSYRKKQQPKLNAHMKNCLSQKNVLSELFNNFQFIAFNIFFCISQILAVIRGVDAPIRPQAFLSGNPHANTHTTHELTLAYSHTHTQIQKYCCTLILRIVFIDSFANYFAILQWIHSLAQVLNKFLFSCNTTIVYVFVSVCV